MTFTLGLSARCSSITLCPRGKPGLSRVETTLVNELQWIVVAVHANM